VERAERKSDSAHSQAGATTCAVIGKTFFSACALALSAFLMIEAGARAEEPAQDDATVLSVVASAFCSAYPVDYLNLNSRAAVPPGSLDDSHGQALLDSDVVRLLKERNRSGAMMPGDANFACLRRTDSEEIDEAFGANRGNAATRPSRGADWTAFYKAFRGSKGVVSMSLPAYSNARHQATVYLSHTCGRLCGQGILYVLKRNDDSWVLIKTVSLWIS
jgi:hypothetical protein